MPHNLIHSVMDPPERRRHGRVGLRACPACRSMAASVVLRPPGAMYVRCTACESVWIMRTDGGRVDRATEPPERHRHA